MKLTEEIKKRIIEENDAMWEKQYGHLTKEERKKLGAFFTPGPLVIMLLEQLDNLNGSVLDPCCGSGNLLMGAILAGADPKEVYGNEFDAELVSIARERLEPYGVPWYHIHQGDARNAECIKKESFTPDYTFTEDMIVQKAKAKKKK